MSSHRFNPLVGFTYKPDVDIGRAGKTKDTNFLEASTVTLPLEVVMQLIILVGQTQFSNRSLLWLRHESPELSTGRKDTQVGSCHDFAGF